MKKYCSITLIVAAFASAVLMPGAVAESSGPAGPNTVGAIAAPPPPPMGAEPRKPSDTPEARGSTSGAGSKELEPGKVDFSADLTQLDPDNRVTAKGNVKLAYRYFTIASDSADVDLKTNIGVFKGRVVFSTKDASVTGEQLTLNLKTKDWAFDKADTRLSPTVLQGKISQPAILTGTQVSESNGVYKLSGGAFTTCDSENPHYCFRAKDLEIYPGSKIVAHRVSVIGMGKLLFTLPSLLIPVKQFKSNLIPQVGSSADEGMYLKSAYAYMATANAQGIWKLDLMQKRGVGTGVEHTYKTATGNGLLSLYYLRDQQIGGNNVSGHVQHQQKLGSLNLNVSSDYRTNSYQYYPASTSQNWAVALSQLSKKSNSELSFRNDSNSGGGTYSTFTSSFRNTEQFTSKLTSMFSMDMRSFDSSSGQTTNSQRDLESSFEMKQRDDKYDLTLTATKRFDLNGGATSSFYSGLDRLPELTLETDSFRFGDKAFFGIPFRLMVSAGKYHESPSGITNNRLLLQWDMMNKTIELGSRNDLSLSTGFRQAIYANNMAQYLLKTNCELSSRFGDYLKTHLSYDYERPEGYSPFQFDYTGKYNNARFVMDFQNRQKLRWSLSTGYDFDRANKQPWQDMALRLTARPNSLYSFSLSTGYDMNLSQMRTVITQVKIDMPNRIGLDMGTSYDIVNHKLNLARGRFSLNVARDWKIEGITSWNGSSKSFDYNAFRLTRDLHCMEMSLTYNSATGISTNPGISLDFRIKAFPGQDRFGIGQYGQVVDSSMGEYYY